MTEGLPGILERYHAASLAARDAEFFVRARLNGRKGYLTRELAEAWRIGCAPTLAQCAQAWAAAGFDRATCERELRSAGLLIDPVADGPDRSAYMFFRDCMIFAWHGPATKDGPGSLLYFSSRRLKDLEIDGTPLPKDKKALCMRSPGQDGKGGLARPPGFNLPALGRADLQELAVVEGALDAIACTAMGHVAVAQIGAAIREDLGKLLRAWLAADASRTLYFIPDASPDMKPLKRLQGCRHAGPHIRIALLPVNRDPDEVTAEELAAAKAAAEPAWRVTVDTMVGLVELEGQGADALATAGARPGEHKDLWQQLCAWAKADRALGEKIWEVYARYQLNFLSAEEAAEQRQALGLGPVAVAVRANETERWLDEIFMERLRQAAALADTPRDRAVTELFRSLVGVWLDLSAVARDRIKETTCSTLDLGKRAFDRALKESFAATGGSFVNENDGTNWPGLARAFLGEMGPERAYKRWRQYWYEWSRARGCYRQLEDEKMETVVNAWLEARGVPVTQTATGNFLNALMMFCFIEQDVEPPRWLAGNEETQHVYVSFRNGILDLMNPERPPKPHSPDFWSLCALPFDYDPAATCPQFERAVERWQPARELTAEQFLQTPDHARLQTTVGDEKRFYSIEPQLVLQEFMGYVFVPGNPRQKLMLNIGEGNDGKTQYLEVLARMVGEANISAQGLEAFDPRQQFGLEPLLGKLVNVVGDANDLDRVGEGTLKQIVGGDMISVNRKNKSVVNVRLGVKFVMLANQLPPFRDRSEGIWRRLLIVKWEHPIKSFEVVEEFAKKLVTEEAAGIFNWALAGFHRVTKLGFTSGAIMKANVDEARRKVQKEQNFFDEALEVAVTAEGLFDENIHTLGDDIVGAYKDWALKNNQKKGLYGDNLLDEMRRWIKKHYPLAMERIEEGARSSKGFRRRHGSGKRLYYYVGVALRKDAPGTATSGLTSWMQPAGTRGNGRGRSALLDAADSS